MFQRFRSWVITQAPVIETLAVEVAIEFALHEAEGRPRPSGVLDLVQRLLVTLFRCVGKEEESPTRDPRFIKAKGEILLSGTSAMVQPAAHLDLRKLVDFLKANPLGEEARWKDLRDRAMVLYTLALGRRPSNATRAVAPEAREMCPWGIRISEFKFKTDRSRKGHHVFLPVADSQEVCPVAALRRYLNHPQTKRLMAHARRLRPLERPPLFLKAPGCAVAPGTVGLRIQQSFADAGVCVDVLGNRATARDIRAALYSRVKNLARKVDSSIICHMMSWKLKKVRDAHYLRAGGPANWSNFVFFDADHPVAGADFVWITLEDFYLWERDHAHVPAVPTFPQLEDVVPLSIGLSPPSPPDPSLGDRQSLPRYITGSVGHGADSESNVESEKEHTSFHQRIKTT